MNAICKNEYKIAAPPPKKKKNQHDFKFLYNLN